MRSALCSDGTVYEENAKARFPKPQLLIYPLFIPGAGCAVRCIYCDQSKITGAPAFDLDCAAREVETFVRHHPDQEKQIAFYGGSFTRLPLEERDRMLQRLLPLLDAHTSFRISTHPLWINPEILSWCQAHRIKTIELGIQDFHDAVLSASLRGYSSEEAIKACRSVQDAGFELGVQLMPGLPGSGNASLQKNFQRLAELKPQLLRLYPLIVVKGTQLEVQYHAGKYTPLSLDEAVNICADYSKHADSLGIRIIKLGIPSNISPSDIVAGPYHPAFGEFVRAELLVRKLALDYQPGQLILLKRNQISLLHGHQGRYLKILYDRLKTCSLEIKFEEVPKPQLIQAETRG